MIRKVLQWLGSPSVTIAILLALAVLFLAGLWIPQKAVLQRDLYRSWEAESPMLVQWLEAAGLTDIHRSPLAKALWGAFFVNLLAGLVKRIPGIVRRVRLADAIPEPAATGWPLRRSLPAGPGDGLERARAFFAGRAYAVAGGQDRLRAVKNRVSPLATILFHASFLVLLGGALTSVATRFEGTVELAEGERFTGEPTRYATWPRLAPWSRWPAARFTVERVLPETTDGVAVGVTVRLREDSGTARQLEINRPYRAQDGTSFVFNDLGVAPILALTTLDGEELWSGGIRLRMDGEVERFRVGAIPVRVRVYPDWVEMDGQDGTRSREVRNLALRIALEGAAAGSRLLRPGESVDLGAYVLHFPDWRYWVKLYVRSERGIGVIFAGFGMATAALVWRLVFYRREYLVASRGGDSEIEVAGRSDYYRSLFADEFERVVSDLAIALRGPAPRAGER